MIDKNVYDKNGFDKFGYNRFGFDKFGYNRQGLDRDGYNRRGFNAEGYHKITGLNKDGFDRYGYNAEGYNIDGYDREGYNCDGFSKDGYDREGFNLDGYDSEGFGRDGFNSLGFSRAGYDKDGYDINGWNKVGFNREGYNVNGFDLNGYDREGYNCLGFDIDGYNKNGFDKNGYDKNGFDIDGFGFDGYDKNGYDREGYNRDGFDVEEFDREGYNKAGYNRNGYDVNGYDIDGFNSSGYNKQGYDREGFNENGFDEEGYDKEGFNKNGFNRLGYDYQGYDIEGFNESGFNVEGFNKEGYNAQGYDKKGFNKDGFNADGFNRAGYDHSGYDKDGLDRYGFAKDGYDIDGYDAFGRDRDGYGLTGFDKEGYNREGFNQDGFYKLDFDENGYNIYTGLNADGYDRDGYNINGLNKDGYDREGFDIDGFDRDGYGRDGYNIEGYHSSGYNRAGYDKYGFNRLGYDKYGYNRSGFDKHGYNRLGFDKEGYDKNGLDRNGKRKPYIINRKQIKSGLRIKNKQTGEYGRIDDCRQSRVYYTMDSYIGTSIRTEASIENFMQLFLIDDNAMGPDQEREALYYSKVRGFLYTKYRDTVLIPEAKRKVVLKERKYIDKYGFYQHETEKYDEVQLRFKAEEEARKIANDAYFAHVDYRENRDLYIGKNALPGYVIDWADRRAAYYYEYKIYTIDSKLGINFVRNIKIRNDRISDFNDLYNRKGNNSRGNLASHASIADEKLIEIIERNRASKVIHDIVESIQTKQYQIITQNMEKRCLVLGCAGSGKTMILLHRIRYIMFNHPEIDANKLVVVSPTDILGRESRELAKILNIDKVNQYSTANYYAKIIHDICHANKLFHRVDEFCVIEEQTAIDEKDISICMEILKGNDLQKSHYINRSQRQLIKEKTELSDIIGQNEMLYANQFYLTAMKELQVYSNKDIEAIIHYVTNKIEKELPVRENRAFALLYLLESMKKGVSKRDEFDRNKITRHLKKLMMYVDKIAVEDIEEINMMNTKHPVTRFVQMVALFAGIKDAKEVKQTIDDIKGLTYGEIEYYALEIDAELQKIRKLSRIRDALTYSMGIVQYSNSNSAKTLQLQTIDCHFDALVHFIDLVEVKCDKADINPFTLFYAYNDIVSEIGMIEQADKSDNYIFDMLIRQLHIDRNRKNRKIQISKQQLQRIFHLLFEKYQNTDECKYYIYLDEFQDYSTEELNDIRKYMQNSIINLYGDVKQCINKNGIRNVEEVLKILPFDEKYELKENYRNSSNITEYVNKRFGMDMYEIGLPGSVSESHYIALKTLESDDRAAIIVADESVISSLRMIHV